MKNLKFITSILFVLAITQITAQTEPSGAMNATTVKTMNYMRDGAKIPYTITVQESRQYFAKLDKKDVEQVHTNTMATPAKVAKLISISSMVNPSENARISLKYEKQIADTYDLESTDRGFLITVGDKSVEYIMGKGIYFANAMDKEFFIIDEYDMVK